MAITDVIPFGIGAAVYTLFTIYHVRLANSFIGPYKDKIFYYFSHLITMIPIITYLFQITNILVFPASKPSLIIFYLQWSFTTPLILMNLGRLANFGIQNYIYITLFDELMIVSGYISYVATNPILVYICFIIGCIQYCILAGLFLWHTKQFYVLSANTSPLISLFGNNLRYKVYRVLLGTIFTSWCFYPITHILYKLQINDTGVTSIIYIILDVCTKGIFTNLLLGSREMYRKSPSFLSRISRIVFRVHPQELTNSESSLELYIQSPRLTPTSTPTPTSKPTSTPTKTSVHDTSAQRVSQVHSESEDSTELTNYAVRVSTEEVIPISNVPTELKTVFVPILDSIDEVKPAK